MYQDIKLRGDFVISEGDFVSTTDGFHGKIRTICSNDFIVLLLDDKSCHVCKRTMIVGEEDFECEEKTYFYSIQKVSETNNKEVRNIENPKQLSLFDII